MTVQLKEYTHEGKTFLATGFVSYNNELDFPYHARRADGEESWFTSYHEAVDFIGEGLIKPQNWVVK